MINNILMQATNIRWVSYYYDLHAFIRIKEYKMLMQKYLYKVRNLLHCDARCPSSLQ